MIIRMDNCFGEYLESRSFKEPNQKPKKNETNVFYANKAFSCYLEEEERKLKEKDENNLER